MWSELANSYLEHAQVSDAIAAYLRAADTTKYNEVIAKASEVWSPPAQPVAGCGMPARFPNQSRFEMCSLKTSSFRFDSAVWAVRGPGQVPAYGAQESQGPQGAAPSSCILCFSVVKPGACRALQRTIVLFCLGKAVDQPAERHCLDSFPTHVRVCVLSNPLEHPLNACKQVDTELVYAYAKNKDLGALEEFITGSHLANLQAVGDRCVCAVIVWRCSEQVTGSLALHYLLSLSIINCPFSLWCSWQVL